MRAVLLLSCFVAAWSFGIRNWGLERRGDAIAAALNTKHLLNFDPVKVADSYKLQAFDPTACGQAWGYMASLLNASIEPCAEILRLFKTVNTATDAANMFLLDRFCNSSGPPTCVAKYQGAYANMLLACEGFKPDFAANILGNSTDMVARTFKALITVPCLNISEEFQAPSTPDPRDALLPAINATTYPVTYCWVHFSRASRLHPATVTEVQLDGSCTACAQNVANVLTEVGVAPLAFASRQALAYCLKRDGNYCAFKVQAFFNASSDPDFQTRIASNPTNDDLVKVCDPCVKWGLQLGGHIMKSLKKMEEVQNTSLGYDPTMDAQLTQATDLLSVSCDKSDSYCVQKLAKYSIASLTTKFIACTSKGCGKATPDYCQMNLTAMYREVGCCLGTFMRTLTLPAAKAQFPAGVDVGGVVQSILSGCGWKVPPTCSQKKSRVTFALKNVKYDWVSKVAAMNPSPLSAWFAATIGVDPNIIEVDCWETSAVDNSATCNVTWSPNQTPDAEIFEDDFENNKAAGVIRVTEFDTADLASDAFIDPSLPAYDFNDFVASTFTSCIEATPPVNYAYNAATDSCEPLCENGIMDQDETDIDCGGVGCPECALNKKCKKDSDCVAVNNSRAVVCNQKEQICSFSSAVSLMISPLVLLVGLFAIFLM